MTLKVKADTIGAISGSLCLIHCMGTPFLFMAKASSAACCTDTPIWWQFIDYFFIVVSFIAIYFTTKTTTKTWLQIALWGSWMLLLLAILNETFEITLQSEAFIYIPALAIIGLHFYNLKYCKCSGNDCCVT